jgi:spermidine synthase
VAVVGLGTGTLACYARPTEQWTFYEIDPGIKKVASDPRFFTYLKDSHAARIDVVLGDARLRLAEAPPKRYKAIFLDAFSSDTVPLHLLTREAFALYLSKLEDDGWLAFNITNRSLDFAPVVARLAEDARLVAYMRDDQPERPELFAKGFFASRWAVMAARDQLLETLGRDRRWIRLKADHQASLWTDDFCPLLEALRWN